MTFTEAAAEVLRLAGKPMHYKEITELAIEKNLLSHVGKSPEVTMGARLAALLKKEEKDTPIVRVRPGVFALRDWKGKAPGPAVEAPEDDENDALSVNALEVEAAENAAAEPTVEVAETTEAGEQPAAPAERREPARVVTRARAAAPVVIEDDEEQSVVSPEDAHRADLVASGAELFDDEDDDDQPIFGNAATDEASDANGDSNRRRRRRRRRGRGRAEGEPASSPRVADAAADSTEAPIEAPAAPRARPAANVEVQETGEELGGKELADSALMVLAGFDRSQGPLALRNVAEALSRRGRVSSDPVLASAQVAASLRADNLRRQALGQRPRFRFAAQGRVALTDWSLSSDLLRLEQEALIAVDRYRDAARKMLLRRLQELPGHAFIELALLALERVGMTQIRTIRRPGSPGGEAHFAGVHKTGTDDIRTALVIRKDGREIGRERVTDLRGALHHYGPAQAGWVISTGQVLSGARDEAGAPGAAPVALFDGLSFARLLEENGVGVNRTHVSIAVPDLELLESLRGA